MEEKVRQTVYLFEQYSSGDRKTWEEEVAEDREFVNNAQWDETEKRYLQSKNQPALPINEMKPARDQVVGQITKNNPRWLAVAVENSDVKLAGDVSDLMAWIWDSSNGNMHFRAAVEDFIDTGLFAEMVYVDPNGDMGKGEIRICRLDPQKVYIDPRCTYRNAQDSDNIFLMDVMSEHNIKIHYPDFDFTDAVEHKAAKKTGVRAKQQNQVFEGKFLGSQKYYRILDRYEKIKVDHLRIYDPNTIFEKVVDERGYQEFASQPAVILSKLGEEKPIYEEEEVKKAIRLKNIYGSIFHYMSDGTIRSGVEAGTEVSQDGTIIFPVPNSTLRVTQYTVFDLINQGFLKVEPVKVNRIKRTLIIGEKLYYEQILPISKYPFAITMLHHTGSPYCYGDARLAKPIQEQINKINSLIIAYNTNIANVKVFLPKGSGIKKEEVKKEFGKSGTAVFEYEAEGGVPLFVQLQQMSNAFYEQLDRAKIHIQRLYGAYEFQDGLISAPPQTRGGTLAIYEAGLNRTNSKLQLIESALNDLGSVVAELVPHVYDRRKVIRIVTPNNKVKELFFNERIEENGESKIVNDLTANKYDFRMVSGSTLPTNRQARFEAYMQLFELGAIRNPEPILRLTDLPDIEEVIESENALKQAQQIIQELTDAVDQLRGDKQTSDRELENADRQVSKAKFDAKLAGIAAKLEQSQLLAQYRLRDMENQKKKEITKQQSNNNKPSKGSKKS